MYSIYKRTYFKTICVHQSDSSSVTIYSTQDSKINMKKPAFWYNPVCSTQSYVNQFLALRNGVFLWMCKRDESYMQNCTGGRKAGGGMETVEKEEIFCHRIL